MGSDMRGWIEWENEKRAKAAIAACRIFLTLPTRGCDLGPVEEEAYAEARRLAEEATAAIRG